MMAIFIFIFPVSPSISPLPPLSGVSAYTYTRVYVIRPRRNPVRIESLYRVGGGSGGSGERGDGRTRGISNGAFAASNTDGPRFLERKIVKTKTIEQIQGKKGYVIRLYNTNTDTSKPTLCFYGIT